MQKARRGAAGRGSTHRCTLPIKRSRVHVPTPTSYKCRDSFAHNSLVKYILNKLEEGHTGAYSGIAAKHTNLLQFFKIGKHSLQHFLGHFVSRKLCGVCIQHELHSPIPNQQELIIGCLRIPSAGLVCYCHVTL